MREYSIDRERLFRILDDGQAANAQMRGLGAENEALRADLDKLEIGIAGSKTLADKTVNPQSARRLEALKAQVKRSQARRSEAAAVLVPRIALARRAADFARSNHMAEEVSPYALA